MLLQLHNLEICYASTRGILCQKIFSSGENKRKIIENSLETKFSRKLLFGGWEKAFLL